jgi:hypothetical protein
MYVQNGSVKLRKWREGAPSWARCWFHASMSGSERRTAISCANRNAMTQATARTAIAARRWRRATWSSEKRGEGSRPDR